MSKSFFVAISILAGLFFAFSAQAVVMRPFGGRVAVWPVPAVTCVSALATQFTIVPYIPSPPGPYTAFITDPRYPILPGVFIKGLYNPIPTANCFTDSLPPIPIPTFNTTYPFYKTELTPL